MSRSCVGAIVSHLFSYERKFLHLRAADGHESFALCGSTPRGSGTSFTIEIFSLHGEDFPAFLSYAFSNLHSLRFDNKSSMRN